MCREVGTEYEDNGYISCFWLKVTLVFEGWNSI